jgi:hypothetical protein
MPRGGGMKMLRAPKYFRALKGGSESSQYTEGGGGGGYKLFKVLVQQGPVVK